MDGTGCEGSEARFVAYVEALGQVLGHADRQEPMRDYCLGLVAATERQAGSNSGVEPLQFERIVTAAGEPGTGFYKTSKIVTS